MTDHLKFNKVVKSVLLTFLALTAFALNSVICRVALKDELIDPGMFTSIRLVSGALVLFVIIYMTGKGQTGSTKGSWISGFMLFLYAAAFSYSYLTLETASGALILFGSVQITMIGHALLKGYKMHLWEWLGIILAISGFTFLLLPGARAPSLSGFILMGLSGIGWGIYSLRGKGSPNPLRDTAYNFLRAVPFLILLLFILLREKNYTSEGIGLALLSGTVTSGLGYTIWYIALKGLSSIQASVVQLLVPVLAAIGGVVFVNEMINSKLIIAAIMVLGGILLVIVRQKSKP